MVWLFSSVVRVGCVMLLNVCGSAIVYLLSDAGDDDDDDDDDGDDDDDDSDDDDDGDEDGDEDI